MGKFGYGEENERGERLLNFCLGNSLKIKNTQFYQRKANRKWTWESPDGKKPERDRLRYGKHQMEEQCYNGPDFHKAGCGLRSQPGNGRDKSQAEDYT